MDGGEGYTELSTPTETDRFTICWKKCWTWRPRLPPLPFWSWLLAGLDLEPWKSKWVNNSTVPCCHKAQLIVVITHNSLLFWIVKLIISALCDLGSFFQENGLTFSFEAVKRLHELVQTSGLMGQTNPRLRASTGSPCADPLLPQEFLPICRQRGASASLTRLGEPVFRIRFINDRQVLAVSDVFLFFGFFQLWSLWICVRSAPLQPALAVKPIQLNQITARG